MTKTFRYPISYKQGYDNNDDLCWIGEQKQLGIRCVEYGYYDCKDAVEREIKKELVNRFDARYGAGIVCETLSVRAEAQVSVRRNASLADFGIGADEELSAEERRQHAQDLTDQIEAIKADHDAKWGVD